MANIDRIEFYCDNEMIAYVNSSMIPKIGYYINVRDIKYRIGEISFVFNYADCKLNKGMKCHVNLTREENV